MMLLLICVGVLLCAGCSKKESAAANLQEGSYTVTDFTNTKLTFSEKPNNDILPRLREILLGDSHIRQSDAPDIKLKENIKEAV